MTDASTFGLTLPDQKKSGVAQKQAPSADRSTEFGVSLPAKEGQPDQSGTWYGALWRGLTHEVAQMGRGTAELAEHMPSLPGLNFAREEGPRQFIGPPPKGGAPTKFPEHQGPWPSAFSSEAARQRALADTQQGIAQSEQQYQADPQVQAHGLAAGTGRVLGGVGAGLLPGGAAAGAARMGVPGAAGLARGLLGAGGSGAQTTGRAILGRMGAGAAGGAIGGAAQPVGPTGSAGEYFAEKAKLVFGSGIAGAAIGGVGGALGPPLTHAAQDALGKFPHIAALVRGTALRSPDNFVKGAMNQALDPIKVTVPPDVRGGHDLLDWGTKVFRDTYDRVLAPMNMQVTPQFAQAMQAAKTFTGDLPRDKHEQLVAYLETHLEDPLKANKGQLTGEQIKDIQSRLGNKGSRALGSADEDTRDFGRALLDVREEFMKVVRAQNPAGAAELANVDNAYAMFARVRGASIRDVDKKGYFTPHDLAMTARTQEKSSGKQAFSTGDAPMQAVAEAAMGPMSAPKVNRTLMGLLGHAVGWSGGPMGAGVGTAAGMIAPEVAQKAVRWAQTPIARGIGTGVSALAPGGGSEAARGFESVIRREKTRHTTEPPQL